jgi:hypothetical protein
MTGDDHGNVQPFCLQDRPDAIVKHAIVTVAAGTYQATYAVKTAGRQ